MTVTEDSDLSGFVEIAASKDTFKIALTCHLMAVFCRRSHGSGQEN